MSTAVSPGTGATPAASPSPRARGLSGWWFRPVPLARIAVVRTIAYLFVPVDVFLTTAWIRAHADVPTEWYQPLTIGQLLPLPAPTPVVVAVVQWALVAAALAAATGRSPRLLGTAVLLLYVQWMVIGSATSSCSPCCTPSAACGGATSARRRPPGGPWPPSSSR